MACIHRHTQTFPFVPWKGPARAALLFQMALTCKLGALHWAWFLKRLPPAGLTGKGCLLWLLLIWESTWARVSAGELLLDFVCLFLRVKK